MANKTYLDQIVEYPAKVIQKIAEDKNCVGLLVNKAFADVTEDDFDKALDKYLFDYQYVDETTQVSCAYVWVEMEVNRVDNMQIKDGRVYVTIACHKSYMDLDNKTFVGISGNRRDNLVRYIDRLLNGKSIMGIGAMKLVSVKTITPVSGFAIREITYAIPDFNLVDLST